MKTQAHEYNALYENETTRLMAKVQVLNAQLMSLRELKYQLLQLFHMMPLWDSKKFKAVEDELTETAKQLWIAKQVLAEHILENGYADPINELVEYALQVTL